jgi:hypothetical protein
MERILHDGRELILPVGPGGTDGDRFVRLVLSDEPVARLPGRGGRVRRWL